MKSHYKRICTDFITLSTVILLAVIVSGIVSGCTESEVRPPADGFSTDGTPETIISRIGRWSATLGALCIVFGIIAAWFDRKKAFLLGGVGFSLAIGSSCIIWIGEHVTVLALTGSVLGSLYIILRYRRTLVHELEELTHKDLNNDNKIGQHDYQPEDITTAKTQTLMVHKKDEET